jgi:hypothetical protein
MPKTRALLALAVIPLIVFILSCGGDDDDNSDNSSSSGNSPAASNSDSPSNSGSSSSSSSDSNNSSSSSDSNDPDANEILQNCPQLLGFMSSFASLANPAAGNAQDDFENTVKVFQSAAQNAPAEIKDDMLTLANGLADYFAALNDLGVDLANPSSFATLNADQLAKLQTALASFDNDAFQQASDNVGNYFEENCSS